MTKEQALHSFWAGFGVPAYEANTVPDGTALPRITYEVSTDSFGASVSLTASIWDRSTSWKTANNLAKSVSEALSCGGVNIPYDDGFIWLKTRSPFSQHMSDPDDGIRRILLSLEAEFLSEV